MKTKECEVLKGFFGYGGRTYKPGDLVELPEKDAITLIKIGQVKGTNDVNPPQEDFAEIEIPNKSPKP